MLVGLSSELHSQLCANVPSLPFTPELAITKSILIIELLELAISTRITPFPTHSPLFVVSQLDNPSYYIVLPESAFELLCRSGNIIDFTIDPITRRIRLVGD